MTGFVRVSEMLKNSEKSGFQSNWPNSSWVESKRCLTDLWRGAGNSKTKLNRCLTIDLQDDFPVT